MSRYLWAKAWRHGLEQARRRMTTPDLMETLAYCAAHPGKLNRQDLVVTRRELRRRHVNYEVQS